MRWIGPTGLYRPPSQATHGTERTVRSRMALYNWPWWLLALISMKTDVKMKLFFNRSKSRICLCVSHVKCWPICNWKKNTPFGEIKKINADLYFVYVPYLGLAKNIAPNRSRFATLRWSPFTPDGGALAGYLAHARSLQTSEWEREGAARGKWHRITAFIIFIIYINFLSLRHR